jgi:hypothetical protein
LGFYVFSELGTSMVIVLCMVVWSCRGCQEKVLFSYSIV